jgi:predicted house-cleaning NTP pyrophosphatase (Maf/HAM1 superfamily)
MDKAGSYAIQGIFGKYIDKYQGDYDNVVGLPANRLVKELKENFDVEI